MIGDWDVQNTFPTSATKRQRNDDPGEARDVEPPAKISRTSPRPARHRKGECAAPGTPDTTQHELEENVAESAKHSNTVAACSPQSITSVVEKFLTWACKESGLFGSLCIVVSNDTVALKCYHDQAKSIRSTPNVYLIEKKEMPNWLEPAGNTEKSVLFASSHVLLDMLSRGSLSMALISAFVVCDASVLKDKDQNPTLLKILADCYSPTAPLPRPRVLVLIPTPQFDIISIPDIIELKTTFAAAMFGITQPEIDILSGRPTELVLTYGPSRDVRETLLCQRLRECDPGFVHFDHCFRNAGLALRELGSCAADLFWREVFLSDGAHPGSIQNNTYIRAREVVKQWPFKPPNVDITSRRMNVSHKFFRLVQVLECCQLYGNDFRGIIFVHKRIIAQLLVALIHNMMPRLQFIRPVAITNHLITGHTALEALSQQLASGQYNLIIATKSFEDISLPRVPIVIFFNIFESQLSRAYAHSCVLGGESHLVHMVEHQNITHRHALSQTALDTEMLRWADAMRDVTSLGIPPRPLSESNVPYNSDSEDGEDGEFLQDPVAGGRLYRHQATGTFLRFAARAAMQEGILRDKPLFDYELSQGDSHNKWCCTIRLPGTSVNGLSGPAALSKPLARREVCYIAFQRLQHLAQVDSTILPLNKTENYELQGGAFDVQLDRAHEQPYSPLSPEFWPNSISRSAAPPFLYPWVVSTTSPESGLSERAPICILTRTPLPNLPDFVITVFGDSIPLRFHRAAPLDLDPERLELVHKFTTKFCRIIMNKPFEPLTLQEMGYFFVPLQRKWRPPTEADQVSPPLTILDDINWTIVALVSETWAVPLAPPVHLESNLEDAVAQDRAVEFTHRCEIIRIRTDMTPLSEVGDEPLGYSLLKHAAFVNDERFLQGGRTLLEQCHSRRKKFEGLCDPNQPILEVIRMPAATNCLNPRIPSHTEETGKATQLLIPEFSRKSTVPASTLRMGYLLPSITRRIDELLLVKQLNAKILGHCVKDELLVIATASPLAGNDYDYERLELLGDAFLKYLSSIYVFAQIPEGAEGELHTARQMYISNQQLCHAATRIGLPGYIQLKPFNVKTWIPPGMKLGGVQKQQASVDKRSEPLDCAVEPQTKGPPTNRSKHQKKHSKKNPVSSPIANKTIADVAEAIIGAAYISGGREAALKATKALTIPFNEIQEWSDFDLKAAVPYPSGTGGLETSVVGSVEQIIGHTFGDLHLLALALSHTTSNNMEMKNHQRLEFIGDAVLDFLVVRYLFDRNQQATPGDLSVSKSVMVSNSTLAAICVWSGLHKFVHTTHQLGRAIQNYEKALTARQGVSVEKERRPIEQYWKDLDAPKALSDVIESIIGAAFISDNFTQAGVEAIFNNILQPFYERYITP